MDAQIGITLTQTDFDKIENMGAGTVSDKIREMLSNFSTDDLVSYIEKHKKTERTACRLDLNTAMKLEEIAKRLDMAPGKIARAVIEMKLHS